MTVDLALCCDTFGAMLVPVLFIWLVLSKKSSRLKEGGYLGVLSVTAFI